MKILMVAPRFNPKSGGGGYVITNNLCKELTRHNHDVEVWTSDYEAEAEDLGYREFQVMQFETLLTLMGFHITPYMCERAKRVLNETAWGCATHPKYQFDVIHLQGCRTFQNIVVSHYAKKYKIPYIVDAHGFPMQGSIFHRLVLWVFDILFANRIVRNAEYCIAETEAGKKEYLRAGVKEKRIKIIPCPYDLSIFDDLPTRGEFRKKYGIGNDKEIVGFLGGLDKIKGLDRLVRMMPLRADSILVLAGKDMGYKSELVGLINTLGIENRVIFTDYISGRDKLEFLVDCDVCVFPSYAEQGLPFSALESIMCNTPIVVTDGTGSTEDVRKIGCGVIVKPDDSKALSGAIDVAKANLFLVGNGQKYIKENLSINSKVRDYEEVYSMAKHEFDIYLYYAE